jgi:hypothetical protein
MDEREFLKANTLDALILIISGISGQQEASMS